MQKIPCYQTDASQKYIMLLTTSLLAKIREK